MRGLSLILASGIAAGILVECSSGQGQRREQLLAQWSREGVVPVTAANPDGSQSIAVLAWNGYYPVSATAKAGVPSVLRIYTNDTFDCSRAFLIPQLKVRRMLPANGVLEIPVPAQPKGGTLFGTCAMGMYTFTIAFK